LLARDPGVSWETELDIFASDGVCILSSRALVVVLASLCTSHAASGTPLG
jgi:hypothetical protein